MKNGKYRTKAGSTVVVSGKYSGTFDIDFDWLEELWSCSDCHPYIAEGRLLWDCKHHAGRSAELEPVVED